MSRNRQPGPRVMLSIPNPLNADRSTIIWLSIVSTSPNWTGRHVWTREEVLLDTVENPPAIERNPVADDRGDVPHGVERVDAGCRGGCDRR